MVTRRKLLGKQLAGAKAPAREEYRSARLPRRMSARCAHFSRGREKCGPGNASILDWVNWRSRTNMLSPAELIPLAGQLV